MPEEADAHELRELQRKAYGRGGALTDAEAARLRELGRGRQSLPAPPPEAPSVEAGLVDSVPFVFEHPQEARRASTRAGAGDVETEVSGAAPSTSSGTQSSGSPGSGTRSSGSPGSGTQSSGAELPSTSTFIVARRRWWVIAAASALLLVIGIGAGWALFGQRPGTVILTAEQQQRRLELSEAGEYDEGTLRAVAEDEDALVWYATRNSGEQACLVIDIAQASSEACQDSEALDDVGLSASVMVPPNAGSDAESAVTPGSSVNAYMLLSTTGEPMVSIQRWSPDLAMVDQFRGAERTRATELIAHGFNAGLSLVGDFQGEPVWLGTRFSDSDAFIEYCLIVDAADRRTVCSTEFDVAGRGVSTDIDGMVDGVPVTWNLRVQNTQNQMPYLTIAQTVSFLAPGDRLELGGEHGDPIEVTTPGGSGG